MSRKERCPDLGAGPANQPNDDEVAFFIIIPSAAAERGKVVPQRPTLTRVEQKSSAHEKAMTERERLKREIKLLAQTIEANAVTLASKTMTSGRQRSA